VRYFLIDRIDELKRFVYAKGRKCITLSDDCFKHHFPGQPVFPAIGNLQEARPSDPAERSGILTEVFDLAVRTRYA
jgi:3-hydroxymyristoyl/3-hydroxydecanoyl-(acyl carrier protein) dehydratase